MSTDDTKPPAPPKIPCEFGLTARGKPRKRPPREGEGRAPAARAVAGLLTPTLLQQVARLSKGGMTEFEIREALGISRRTWGRWHGKKVFHAALAGDDEIATARVERMLLHRAIGYSHPAVKVMQHQGVVVRARYTEHYPPDVEAAKTWLHNRAGHRWKPKQEGNQGVTVVINSPIVLDALAGRDPSLPSIEREREPVTLEHKP